MYRMTTPLPAYSNFNAIVVTELSSLMTKLTGLRPGRRIDGRRFVDVRRSYGDVP